jgi:hypothetical protein
VYRQLIQTTGGAQGDLCLQDFGPVFAAVSTAVVQGAGLACEWDIPPPADGTINPEQVNVDYTPTGGTRETLGWVANQDACANALNGWYYDDASAPTKVFACPDTCGYIQQGGGGSRIDIKFGCQRVIAPPT